MRSSRRRQHQRLQDGFQQHIQLLERQPQPEVLLDHELGDVLERAGDLLVLGLQLLLLLLLVVGVGHLLARGAVQLPDLVQVQTRVQIQALNMSPLSLYSSST